jgi:uronate dehydrogenase
MESTMKKVLITGMSGLIGKALRARMEGRYELTALNRSEVPGVRCHRADIAHLEAILPAFAGQEVVVHLAANVSVPGTLEELLKANVIGTYNVFEAARRAGVKRVVLASSGAVVSGWEKASPYQELCAGDYEAVAGGWPVMGKDAPLRPNGLYGCTKIWGEALARHFADTTELSVICVRIGRVTALDRPTFPREAAAWCSQRDIARLLEACVEAPPALKHDVFYALSDNRYGYRDMVHVRQVLGFVPEDSADNWDK